MCFSKPSISSPAALPVQTAQQDAAVMASQDSERRRQAAALGRQGTLLTGGAGLTTPATTTPKTLLGQ